VGPPELLDGQGQDVLPAGAADREPGLGGDVADAFAGQAVEEELELPFVLGRDLDPSGFLRAQLFAFRGQILATGPLPESLIAQFPPWAMSSHFCYEYFRAHRDRLVVGGMRWSVPGEQLGILDDSSTDARITDNLIAWVERHFPALTGVPFPRVWTGIMCGTSDALPLVGALPGRPGVFALLGFNGYGLSFAFLAGRVLAEQIVAGRAEHPAARLFAPRRFA